MARATQVSASSSTTAGGVPRVCRTPSTTWAAAYGGTRTSTERPGRPLGEQRQEVLGEQPEVRGTAVAGQGRGHRRRVGRTQPDRHQPSPSRIARVRVHASDDGSITTKWSPSTSTSSAVAPAATARST